MVHGVVVQMVTRMGRPSVASAAKPCEADVTRRLQQAQRHAWRGRLDLFLTAKRHHQAHRHVRHLGRQREARLAHIEVEPIVVAHAVVEAFRVAEQLHLSADVERVGVGFVDFSSRGRGRQGEDGHQPEGKKARTHAHGDLM